MNDLDLKFNIISLVSIAKIYCSESWSKEFEKVGLELSNRLDELQELKEKQRKLVSILDIV